MGRGSPQNQQQHHGRDLLDPFLIAILGILSGALVVAAYHCIGANISLRRRQLEESSSHRQATPRNARLHLPDRPNLVETGWMFLYGKECDGKRYSEEGTCAVCLGEYEDGEVIRALPGCLHDFHAACVDTWLNSHSSCPLCRGCTEPPPHAAIMRDGSGDAEPIGGEARVGS